MSETQSSTDISTKLKQIAKLAKDKPGVALMTLAHHIDVDWLREAFRRTRKDGATGVDGVVLTAENFRRDLTVEPITSVFGSDRRSVTGGGQLRSHLRAVSESIDAIRPPDVDRGVPVTTDRGEEHQPPRTREARSR
jgi:hypothetical protein